MGFIVYFNSNGSIILGQTQKRNSTSHINPLGVYIYFIIYRTIQKVY